MGCHICSFVTCSVPHHAFETHIFVSRMVIPVFLLLSQMPCDECDTGLVGSLTNSQLYSVLFFSTAKILVFSLTGATESVSWAWVCTQMEGILQVDLGHGYTLPV